METQTNHGGAAKRAKRAVKKIAKKAPTQLSREAHVAVQSNANGVLRIARNFGGWIKANPKTAAGVLVGAGLLIGIGTRTRFGRTALLGLSGLATVAAKRFF